MMLAPLKSFHHYETVARLQYSIQRRLTMPSYDALITAISQEKQRPPMIEEPRGCKPGELYVDLGALNSQLEASGMKGDVSQLRVLYQNVAEKPKQIAVFGLGKKETNAAEPKSHELLETIRMGVGSSVKALRNQGAKRIGLYNIVDAKAAAEGAHLALYTFNHLKSANKREGESVSVELVGEAEEQKAWKEGIVTAEAQNFTRMLAEMPANLLTPTIFAEKVQEKLRGINNVEVIARDQEWVKEKKMGLFLSVAQGSEQPSRFLEIHYRGKQQSGKENVDLALVGKGVTFDSGGISLKSSGNMSEMRADMAGAAVVVSSIMAAAQLGTAINVSGFIPLTENMPSGKATKPGDVHVAMNGKSVEIDNTDAEGRLILADALYYASKEFKPKHIMDIATLTGAIGVALGSVYTGVFSSCGELWGKLEDASKKASDPFWRMPFHEEYVNMMAKSTTADLLNAGSRDGGACTAAGFLKQFVSGLEDEDGEKKIKYVHLDIAGVMADQSSNGYKFKGMSGRPTRAIVEFIRSIASNASE